MAKIRSNHSLIYDARDQKQGIVQLEVSNWNFDLTTKNYTAVVKDFLIEQEINEHSEEIFERKLLISVKNLVYSADEIDQLFENLGKEVTLDRPYSEQLNEIITDALLYVTVAEPPYNSNNQSWDKLF